MGSIRRITVVGSRAVDLIGAIAASGYMLLVIAMFIGRIFGCLEVGHWIGIVSSLILVPLAYLFIVGTRTGRRTIYLVWLTLMFVFSLFELIADQILRVDFRGIQWAVILYVMFFFAATGGMIGVAAQAGRRWAMLASALFLIMGVLAFVQRAITGL